MKTNTSLNRPEQAAADAIVNVWIEQHNHRRLNVEKVNLNMIALNAVIQYDTYLRNLHEPVYLSKSKLADLVSRSRDMFYDRRST